MTKLFEDIIFGPVASRRLGLSLGVNLLPTHAKICNFDCIYCECGWNRERRGDMHFNSREEVYVALEQRLKSMMQRGERLDVITFAGNGEPTLNPQFEEIIADTIELRNSYAPTAKVSVLSNATTLGSPSVVRALQCVDNNILKLDSAIETTARLMNNPQSTLYSVACVIDQMMAFGGELIVQTMFLRGQIDGSPIDNTTPDELAAWSRAISKIAPRQVMIYSIDRDTPCKTLSKVEREELLAIAKYIETLGIEVSVA